MFVCLFVCVFLLSCLFTLVFTVLIEPHGNYTSIQLLTYSNAEFRSSIALMCVIATSRFTLLMKCGSETGDQSQDAHNKHTPLSLM